MHRRKNMLPMERRKNILISLHSKGSVSVNELSAAFNVSEETIRRDLLQMEQESLLTRVYGGAYLSDIVAQAVPFQLRKDTEKESKYRIADLCTRFIHSGDTIFLDSSTTALCIAEKIKGIQSITVITNAHAIISCLSDCKDIRIIAVGGELDKDLMCYTGWTTLEALERYNADKAFVSCTGVSIEHGLTDSSEIEGRIRYLMLKNAQRKYLIADHTKFGKTTMSQIMPLDDIDVVICNKELGKDWITEFDRKSIQFVFE